MCVRAVDGVEGGGGEGGEGIGRLWALLTISAQMINDGGCGACVEKHMEFRMHLR